jgi:hypothetical protein
MGRGGRKGLKKDHAKREKILNSFHSLSHAASLQALTMKLSEARERERKVAV